MLKKDKICATRNNCRIRSLGLPGRLCSCIGEVSVLHRRQDSPETVSAGKFHNIHFLFSGIRHRHPATGIRHRQPVRDPATGIRHPASGTRRHPAPAGTRPPASGTTGTGIRSWHRHPVSASGTGIDAATGTPAPGTRQLASASSTGHRHPAYGTRHPASATDTGHLAPAIP